MKLLLVHNFYRSHHVGGEDVVFQQELLALRKRLGEKSVITYTVSNDDLVPRKLLYQIWGNRQHAAAIAAIALKHRVDLVHAHNVFPLLTPYFFSTLKKLNIPTILTLHNYRPWCLSGILYRKEIGACHACFQAQHFLPSIYHQCYRQSLGLSLMGGAALQWYQWRKDWDAIDRFFVLSEHQFAQLQQFGIDAIKLWLKPNFVDTSQVSIDESIPKKDYLYVGRLEPDKGIDWLLEQWQLLPIEYQLTVIGTSPDDVDYANRYARANIHFKGNVDRQTVLSMMAKAKYLIHPSWMPETFGLTVVEAQSLGTPVIGLHCGPRMQLIQHGITGWHYEKDTFLTTMQLAHHFSKYDKMSKAAKQAAAAYQSDIILDKQLAYYEELATYHTA